MNVFAFRFVAVYNLLPETENRTLEEIELHFSDNQRPITDINIQRIVDPKHDHTQNVECGSEKQKSMVGDIVEMNNKTPSVVSTLAAPAANLGCDNKAFTSDR